MNCDFEGNAISSVLNIKVGITQSSLLVPSLNPLYILKLKLVELGGRHFTFADDIMLVCRLEIQLIKILIITMNGYWEIILNLLCNCIVLK